MVALQQKMTNVYKSQLTALSPESGCYSNEADFLQPNWLPTFYGVNHRRLQSVKRKYDPHDIFYATTAVRSNEGVVAVLNRRIDIVLRVSTLEGHSDFSVLCSNDKWFG